MVLTLYEGLIEHQIYPGLFNTAYYEGNNMFSLIKSRKVLFITTLLLLSSAAQPAFALGCIGTVVALQTVQRFVPWRQV